MSETQAPKMEHVYRSRTDAELEQLAQDVIADKVFTSMQVRRMEDMTMVFMMLAFLEREDVEWLKSQDIYFFYEYMDKALPRSINGYPCFLSMQYLSREDYNKLAKRYDEIKNLLAARVAPTL
jgi:hypothetical protein